MACQLILRSMLNPATPDQYYLTGTGWQSTASAGTAYTSKEAAMTDAQTLADAGVSPSDQIVIKDLAAGLEYPIGPLKP